MSHSGPKTPADLCEDHIKNNTICVFGGSLCKYTTNAIKFFNRIGTPFEAVMLDEMGMELYTESLCSLNF